jgi:cytochrome P450
MSTTEKPVVDFLSAATFSQGHPWALYEWLRDDDPVHWHEEPDGPGFWVISRWEDIRWVNAHDDYFSHAPTSILEGAGIVQDSPAMVNVDAPLHTIVRKMAIADFLPGAIRERLPSFEVAARDIITEVRPRGECDLAVDVAGRMASYVTADMLGIPRDDAVRLYDDVEIGLGGGTHSLAEREAATERLMSYGVGVYEDRLRHPGTDVCSHLVRGPAGEPRLGPEEFLSNFALLVVGAGDTTRHLIGGGMLALFERPDQRALLTADLDRLLPTAVEEMLRFVTPVIYNRRQTIKAVELRGRQIGEGDKVVVYYGAGNRDPRQFSEPDLLDLRRSPNNHVAFSGRGAHFCLGAHVARAEGVAMFKALLRELPTIHQSGEVEWALSNQVMGPAHLPVAF